MTSIEGEVGRTDLNNSQIALLLSPDMYVHTAAVCLHFCIPARPRRCQFGYGCVCERYYDNMGAYTSRCLDVLYHIIVARRSSLLCGRIDMVGHLGITDMDSNATLESQRARFQNRYVRKTYVAR